MDNYKSLRDAMNNAVAQAEFGKGKDRHACDEPFEDQVICEVARRLAQSPVAGPLQQVVKKCYESARLPKDKAIAELYGAINYAAAAIILLKEMPDPQEPSCQP